MSEPPTNRIECSPIIGETGAAVTGPELASTKNVSWDFPQANLPNRFVNRDRLRRPEPCPFCAGEVSVMRSLPNGWIARIDHANGCAIGQMGGITAATDEALDEFLIAWGARPVIKSKEPSK